MAEPEIVPPEVFRTASDEAAEKIIEERELSEGSRFFVRKRKLAGVTSVTSLHDLRIKFEDAGRDTVPVIYDGVPFVVVSCDMKECQYGPNRHKSKKGIDSQWKRRRVSRKLREEFGSTTTQEYCVLVQFVGAHGSHVIGRMSDYGNRLDKKVIKNIQTMAQQGTTNVAQVHRRCEDLSEDIVPEHSKNDRRFFPTRKDVYNHIYHTLGDTSSFLHARYTENNDQGVADVWSIESPVHAKQPDSLSCGVYVLKLAERFLNGRNLQFNLTQEELIQTRKSISACLLYAAEQAIDPTESETSTPPTKDVVTSTISPTDTPDLQPQCNESIPVEIECSSNAEDTCTMPTEINDRSSGNESIKRTETGNKSMDVDEKGYILRAERKMVTEELLSKLITDLLVYKRDEKFPVTGMKSQSLRGLNENSALFKGFQEFKTFGSSYIMFIVLKEILIKVACDVTDETYTTVEENCLRTEVNINQIAKTAMKNK